MYKLYISNPNINRTRRIYSYSYGIDRKVVFSEIREVTTDLPTTAWDIIRTNSQDPDKKDRLGATIRLNHTEEVQGVFSLRVTNMAGQRANIAVCYPAPADYVKDKRSPEDYFELFKQESPEGIFDFVNKYDKNGKFLGNNISNIFNSISKEFTKVGKSATIQTDDFFGEASRGFYNQPYEFPISDLVGNGEKKKFKRAKDFIRKNAGLDMYSLGCQISAMVYIANGAKNPSIEAERIPVTIFSMPVYLSDSAGYFYGDWEFANSKMPYIEFVNDPYIVNNPSRYVGIKTYGFTLGTDPNTSAHQLVSTSCNPVTDGGAISILGENSSPLPLPSPRYFGKTYARTRLTLSYDRHQEYTPDGVHFPPKWDIPAPTVMYRNFAVFIHDSPANPLSSVLKYKLFRNICGIIPSGMEALVRFGSDWGGWTPQGRKDNILPDSGKLHPYLNCFEYQDKDFDGGYGQEVSPLKRYDKPNGN